MLWISPRGLSLPSAFTLPDKTFGNDDPLSAQVNYHPMFHAITLAVGLSFALGFSYEKQRIMKKHMPEYLVKAVLTSIC